MKKIVVSSLMMFALLASVSVMAQVANKDIQAKPKSEVKAQTKHETKEVKKETKKVEATANKKVNSDVKAK